MKKTTTILLLILSISVFAQNNCDVTNPSEGFKGGRNCSADGSWTIANDIIVPANTDITLNSIILSIGMNSGINVTSVRVRVYNNANGVPGSLINTQIKTPTSQTYKGNGLGMDFSDIALDLTPISLPGSAGIEISYWVAIQVTTSNNSTAYMETTAATTIGLPIVFSDGNSFITPIPHKDGVYTFYADCEPMVSEDFPFPYCGPLVFLKVEPITLVKLAGINNVSSANLNGSPSHQDFVDIMGEVERGVTYPITLGGNTEGAYNNNFIVFIDWNQNGVLDDEREVYIIEESLYNSTGTDGISIIDDIKVPADALLGTTRMRVKKTFEGPHTNPCVSEATWGQVEDYTIKVVENSEVSVSENIGIKGFSYYPNPSSDIVYLQSVKNIESVKLYNLFGQEVFTTVVQDYSSRIDLSNLSAGTYFMKVVVDGQIGTYKFMKK